jgi:uncharacterized Tic20 family protein
MEPQDIPSKVTQDERILAALSHASVIIPLWGLIGAIVIWATQREKSRFVGFQALQGVVYQLFLIVLAFVGGACYMCSFFGTFLLVPAGIFVTEGAGETDTAAAVISMIVTGFPLCIMGIFALIGFAFVLYGLYGAVRVLQGSDFRYAVIGDRLERYLNQDQTAA